MILDKNIVNTIRYTGRRAYVVFGSHTLAGCLTLFEGETTHSLVLVIPQRSARTIFLKQENHSEQSLTKAHMPNCSFSKNHVHSTF